MVHVLFPSKLHESGSVDATSSLQLLRNNFSLLPRVLSGRAPAPQEFAPFAPIDGRSSISDTM